MKKILLTIILTIISVGTLFPQEVKLTKEGGSIYSQERLLNEAINSLAWVLTELATNNITVGERPLKDDNIDGVIKEANMSFLIVSWKENQITVKTNANYYHLEITFPKNNPELLSDGIIIKEYIEIDGSKVHKKEYELAPSERFIKITQKFNNFYKF